MPWKPKDATRHTKKATTAKLKKIWAEEANRALPEGEGVAVRKANAAVRRASHGRGK